MKISFILKHSSENETFILPADEKNFQQFSREKQAYLSLEEMDDSKEPQKVSPSEAINLLDLVQLSLLQQYGNYKESSAEIRLLLNTLLTALRLTLFQSTSGKNVS
ncbi:hypothetical protein GcC1_072023 [Golovinomyces cichoracearum]|uniref:Uncharacterized protein n=1 Tax=Golovinomyces cichoracearum TaxID=62708 RepID=A0A420IPC2_9PEZI|nr:hypothetical protein GcC1_072023 [Golovinomyces cichoracearum]